MMQTGIKRLLIILIPLIIFSCLEDRSSAQIPEPLTGNQDPNFHIYICFGQSNMEGWGAIESQDVTINERFKTFQAIDCPNLNRVKEAWYSAQPPLTRCDTQLSPVDYFGRNMIENIGDHITIGVINVSVGGGDIRLFDKDLYQGHLNTFNEYWYIDALEAYDSNLT